MADTAPVCILVVAPNWLGDAVMATPVFRVLRRRFPQSRIVVAGPPSIGLLLEGLPAIDQFYPLPPRANTAELWAGARRIRKENHPDWAILLPHSLRSALLACMAGARRRIGYARGGRRLLLTDAVEPYRVNGSIEPIYMAREYLGLTAAVGADADEEGLELAVDPAEAAYVRQHLDGPGPWVAIAPGAAFGPSKRWIPERFAAVADRLADEKGARCLLLTGPGEEETRDAVQAAARIPLIECPGGGIARLKALLERADLLIGNDSGPRHIAIAFKKPVICIMGSTSPKYTDSPWEIGRLLRVPVDCGPCQKPVCTTDHRCMTGISADQVVEAARAYLPE